jgi:hypothetical protein
MDPRIEKLKAAGFSDDDIKEYLASSPPPGGADQQSAGAEPPSVNMEVPPTEAAAVPPEANWMEKGVTAAKAIIPDNPMDALVKVGEGALAYKGLQAWKQSSLASQARAAAEQAAEAGRQARFNAKFPAPTTVAAPPVAPPVAPPAAPPAAPAAAQQSGIMQRGMDYARQMQRVAADKVMQGARAVAPYAESAAGAARSIAPAAIGLTAALMPGNANQNYPVPQKGPYRGMEINPNTRRPWTAQELAQINR